MSDKDIKKGIAIQAKVDAEKIEKLTSGLKSHRDVLSSLKIGQNEIRDTLGIVIDDLAIGEAKELYDLKVQKKPIELDDTEKRVVCASIYTLLVNYNQNSFYQVEFYSNFEKYLGIVERKSDFDFSLLNNIDSYIDRLVILKVICSFLFLYNNSFSFLKDKDKYGWLFGFVSVKDIIDVCSVINEEYAVLGERGLIDNYSPTLSINVNQQNLNEEEKSEDENVEEIIEDPNNTYDELINIVINDLSDEKSFGKGIALSEDEIAKELHLISSRISLESIIAISKIEKGLLIFTTYAFYIKSSSKSNKNYVCVPYANIIFDNMITVEGKIKGTRKLIIPFKFEQDTKILDIDDSKIQEEKLRDLLLKINQTKCTIAKTDRVIEINDLDYSLKTQLLSVLCYMFRINNLPLIDIYLLSQEWELIDKWDVIASACDTEESYNSIANNYIQSIPYPSKKYTLYQTMKLIMSLIVHTNIIIGNESMELSIKMEKQIYVFAPEKIDEKQFNLLFEESIKNIKDMSIEEYENIKNDLSQKDIVCKDFVYPYFDMLILRIKNIKDYKAKIVIKNKIKDISKIITDEVKNKIVDTINNGISIIKK